MTSSVQLTRQARRRTSHQLTQLPPERQQCQRVALVVQYNGAGFHGWQRQKNAERTVQAVLESAICSVLGYRSAVTGAGRTDAGVHAAAQVAHFQAPAAIPAERWSLILNARLPEDIAIRASATVSDRWHAQFSAQWRRYRYLFYTDTYPNLFVEPYVWHYYHRPLDHVLIQTALKPLLGYHNLAAFHRTGSDRSHSWVEMQEVSCQRAGHLVQVELQANGFLYGMVRLMMGLLVEVGSGRLAPEAFTAVWKNQRRDLVKYSAPPNGLCLLRVGYPSFPFPAEAWKDTQPQFLLA